MGKDSSPPPTPDYAAAATATAQGNLEATRAATAANRINQYTPYGSLTYSQDRSGRTFNQDAYNQALSAYSQQQQSGGQSEPNPGDAWRGVSSSQGSSGGYGGTAPNQADFWTDGNPDGGWSQTVSLSPVGQKLLDYQNNASLGLGEQTQNALNRVNDSLSTPFDYNSVGDVQNAAYKAYTDRLDPQWDQASKAQENTLANQGIPVGSEAYNNAMRTFGQSKNDAYQQANLGAIQTAPQTYQLAQSLRSQPLNELNALRTGSQVQNPTFNSVPQQQTTAGADLLGAQQAQYNAGLGASNASQASSNNATSGLVGLAAAAAAAY